LTGLYRDLDAAVKSFVDSAASEWLGLSCSGEEVFDLLARSGLSRRARAAAAAVECELNTDGGSGAILSIPSSPLVWPHLLWLLDGELGKGLARGVVTFDVLSISPSVVYSLRFAIPLNRLLMSFWDLASGLCDWEAQAEGTNQVGVLLKLQGLADANRAKRSSDAARRRETLESFGRSTPTWFVPSAWASQSHKARCQVPEAHEQSVQRYRGNGASTQRR